MPGTVTIKELHEATGHWVRKASRSRTPTVVTDRGSPVALLVATDCLPPPRRRPRQILPEYAELMSKAPAPGAGVAEDLDALRGDR